MDTPISLNWKIAGKAGEGVMTTSDTFAKVCHRHGLFVFNYYEYPSLIKGGHQTGQVHASSEHASCQKRTLDVLVALNENAFVTHQAEITPETIIICEPEVDGYDISKYQHLSQHIYSVNMTKMSREITGHSIATNTAALGASAYFIGLDPQLFRDILTEQFIGKGQEVVDGNIKVFDTAYTAAQQLSQPKFQVGKFPSKGVLLSGGDAIGMGALAGGLQFYSAYPMSPSSNAFHYIAAQQDKFPLVVRHVEDEIAAINLAVGASYAGVRAMTGSAGGGFALMVETLSLTGVMETPLVILVAQRPGPATGLPTWTGQGDLQFVLHAGHGEFQRIVMTPGDTAEHFELTRKGFELAEKYQIPVLILTDKYLIEAPQTMPAIQEEYQLERYAMVKTEDLPQDDSFRRYAIDTQNGVSPRSIPGQAHGLQITNSYEHDEFGYATEDADMTIHQVEKRAKKMDSIVNEVPQPLFIGPEDADITFVCWGTTLSVLRQMLHDTETLRSQGEQLPTVNIIHFPCIWPFPAEQFTKLAQKAKRLVMIEGNFTGQCELLIRQETGIQFADHIRRYDGRPFYSEDLIEWIKK
ncbi:MAG: 2-oxoacid:acceptor oxidoreductase subunit alpha [Patescibacteria group bacterium]